ncbi:MAG: NYN domain-containing protein [Patescibacteria group bacterium]
MNKENFKAPRNKNDLTGLLANLIQNKKVAVFIDGANLYFAANVANLHIDYKQIYSWFSSKCKLSNLNYYTAFDPDDEKQTLFLDEMDKTGYRIIKKPIKVYENFTKGNMDIELAVDALMQKDDYEILILISGDGDFRYLVNALEEQDKTSIVLGIGGFTSFELHQEADNYFFLNRISRVWQSQRKNKLFAETKMNADDKVPQNLESSNSNKKTKSTVKKDDKVKPPVKLRVKSNNNAPKIFLS